MAGIVGVVAFLTVLSLSLIITRLATTALGLTGLSEEAASFQARSAFTGTGFTTSEAEKVVTHPVRRRIIMLLMIARSAGLVTIIISLILTFGTSETEKNRLVMLLWLSGGVVALWIISLSTVVRGHLNRVVAWAVRRWTDLDTRDYVGLLHLSGEYTVRELHLREGDWLVGKTLEACRLNDEGVTVLGIYRSDGRYVGAPRGDTDLYEDDTVVLYGRSKTLRDLDRRRADAGGDQAHADAVGEQRIHEAQQEQKEQEHREARKKQAG
jgi:NhaP-type Na+/H+ and K+/H+ antiporter